MPEAMQIATRRFRREARPPPDAHSSSSSHASRKQVRYVKSKVEKSEYEPGLS